MSGGQYLKVKGNGFGYGTLAPKIGSDVCTLVPGTNTDDEFECSTKAVAAVTATSGLLLEGQGGIKLTNTYAAEKKTNNTLLLSWEVPTDYASSVTHKAEAWFVPPATTDYRFYMACDDNCWVKLAKEADTTADDKLETIVENKSWVSHREYWYQWISDYGTQTRFMSKWYTLTAGKKYFMKSNHYEGGGGDNFAVAVEIKKSDTAKHHNAFKEIQKISMVGPQDYETTSITV